MKKNPYFPKRKKFYEKIILYIFAHLFNVWLKKIQIIIPASSFNLFQYLVLVETHEENLASYRYVVGKGRSILMTFADNCGHSYLILYKNTTNYGFLKG